MMVKAMTTSPLPQMRKATRSKDEDANSTFGFQGAKRVKTVIIDVVAHPEKAR
jgi:hypothetical protein